MEHVAEENDGSKHPKLLKEYTLPLSGTSLMDLVITCLGVFSINTGERIAHGSDRTCRRCDGQPDQCQDLGRLQGCPEWRRERG